MLRRSQGALEQRIQATIEQAKQCSIPNVIVFSGHREGLDDRMRAEITTEGLRCVVRAAEEAGVTLITELLNSKVDYRDHQVMETRKGEKECIKKHSILRSSAVAISQANTEKHCSPIHS